MYNYSPIHKLYIRNFRNLGDVEIDFSQSPIITLVGENEAGKTSVIKAFATCALHATPRDQKDYIRDGTKMFGVSIELENGMRVVRIKEATGINSYQITDTNNKVIWNTNKISEGLPEEVQKLLGLIAEPETNEFLHIRTYEDKLLFVVTPNSTNYKVMYNALKVEQLTKAIKLGSNEVNGLKSQINSNEASIQTLDYQSKSIEIIDTEPINNIKTRLEEQLATLDKIEQAKKLSDRVMQCQIQLGALALLDRFQLKEINEMLASKLANTSRLVNKNEQVYKVLDNLVLIKSLEEIDTNNIARLYSLLSKISELKAKIDEAGALVHVSEISEISEIVALQLSKVMTLINKIDTLNNNYVTIEVTNCRAIQPDEIDRITKMNKVITLDSNNQAQKNSLIEINDYIDKVQDYMKQCGVAVEICPKCGESVIFDVDKM